MCPSRQDEGVPPYAAARASPLRQFSTRSSPLRSGPARSAPHKSSWPACTTPLRTGPNRTGPNRTEPNRSGPNQTAPNWSGPVRCFFPLWSPLLPVPVWVSHSLSWYRSRTCRCSPRLSPPSPSSLSSHHSHLLSPLLRHHLHLLLCCSRPQPRPFRLSPHLSLRSCWPPPSAVVAGKRRRAHQARRNFPDPLPRPPRPHPCHVLQPRGKGEVVPRLSPPPRPPALLHDRRRPPCSRHCGR